MNGSCPSHLPAKRSRSKKEHVGRSINQRPEEHFAGTLSKECASCQAMHFTTEEVNRTTKLFTSCCKSGKVKLNHIQRYPKTLENLLRPETQNEESKHFFESTRKYNNAFSFTSLGYTPVKLSGGPQAFIVQGQLYHMTASAINVNDPQPIYSQLYFLDPEYATKERLANKYNEGCRPNIVKTIEDCLREINPYAQAYKTMKEVIDSTPTDKITTIEMWIVKDRTKDNRRYNLPTCNEVAAIFKEDDGKPPLKRDICVYPCNQKKIERLHVTSPNNDPMSYPLLFPHGEYGWHPDMDKTTGSRRISQQQYYAYLLHERAQFAPYLHSGKLTQQFIVDSFLKVEANRIQWLRENQKNLRVDMYLGLMDYVASKAKQNNMKPGRIHILPSSFTGSKRAFQQNFQDAMSIVRKFGKPDLFITFTCNPKWKEITSSLCRNESPIDRPDIVSTVFHFKLKAFLDDVIKKKILGNVSAYIYVIEFQKRGKRMIK